MKKVTRFSYSSKLLITIAAEQVVWFHVAVGAILADAGDTIKADTIKAPFTIGLRSHYGFIIPHSETIRSISHSKPRSLEFDISWHLAGDDAWQYFYCYPRVGLAVSWFDFNNSSILGSALSTIVYAEPFLTAQKRFSLSFRLGTGLAYMNNVYDPVANPQNLFYSSPVTFVLVGNLAFNYRLHSRLNIRASGNYNHNSNGGNKEPNKGINYPTAALGVDYTFKPVEFRSRSKKEWHSLGLKKNQVHFYFLSAYKTASLGEEKRYFLWGIAGYAGRYIGRLSTLTAGVEFVSDESLKKKIQRENKQINYQRAAALAGQELIIGRLRLSQQLGVYIYSPYPAKDPVYQRYGLGFKLNSYLLAGVNLKAHRHVADFLDFRMGISF